MVNFLSSIPKLQLLGAAENETCHQQICKNLFWRMFLRCLQKAVRSQTVA